MSSEHRTDGKRKWGLPPLPADHVPASVRIANAEAAKLRTALESISERASYAVTLVRAFPRNIGMEVSMGPDSAVGCWGYTVYDGKYYYGFIGQPSGVEFMSSADLKKLIESPEAKAKSGYVGFVQVKEARVFKSWARSRAASQVSDLVRARAELRPGGPQLHPLPARKR